MSSRYYGAEKYSQNEELEMDLPHLDTIEERLSKLKGYSVEISRLMYGEKKNGKYRKDCKSLYGSCWKRLVCIAEHSGGEERGEMG